MFSNNPEVMLEHNLEARALAVAYAVKIEHLGGNSVQFFIFLELQA